MNFVKPGAAILDPRAQEVKDRELENSTMDNLFHIQKQLVAHGHSLESVIVSAAKNAFGVNIQPHLPAKKDAEAA
jgi:hypothetical protein